jgi:hypothetical protein
MSTSGATFDWRFPQSFAGVTAPDARRLTVSQVGTERHTLAQTGIEQHEVGQR